MVALARVQVRWLREIQAARKGLAPMIMDDALSLREAAKGFTVSDPEADPRDDFDLLMDTEAEKLAAQIGGDKGAKQAKDFFDITTGRKNPIGPLLDEYKLGLRQGDRKDDEAFAAVSKFFTPLGTIEAVTRKVVKDWLLGMQRDGFAVKTIGGKLTYYRAFWRYLQRHDIVPEDVNPFANLEYQQSRTHRDLTIQKNRVHAWTPKEIKQLYNAARSNEDYPLSDLIALAYYTGARIEEICQLTSKEIDGEMIRIEGTKTASSKRSIPIPPQARKLVARLIKESSDGFLIPSTAGNKYGKRSDTLGKRFGILKTGLGYPARTHSFHGLRHSLGSLMEENGATDDDIARQLGHSQSGFSKRTYSRASERRMIELINRIKFPLDAV